MANYGKFFEEKIKDITANSKIIFDMGGGVKFQKGLKRYKRYFNSCALRTIDIDPEANPDILADIHNLPIESEVADAAIFHSVLQHTYNPFQVVDEMYRILKVGGKCLGYTPFIYPYHGGNSKEYYKKDYWRFSRDGLRYLFRKFREIELCEVRGHFETAALVLPYSEKYPIKLLVISGKFLDKIFSKYESRNQVSGFNIFCVK